MALPLSRFLNVEVNYLDPYCKPPCRYEHAALDAARRPI